MDDRPPVMHSENLPVRTVPLDSSRLRPRTRAAALVDAALDELDRIGDRIADVIGIRQRG